MKYLLTLFLALQATASDWPQWRGPTMDNHAAADAAPVTEWSPDKNVLWKTDLPGLGHSTPIVVGAQIFLTTGDTEKGTQSLISINRASGKIQWTKALATGGLPPKIHRENSHASSSPAWDGRHVITTFYNNGQILVSAVSPAGDLVWSKTVGSYHSGYPFGYGASPLIYKGTVIVVSDQEKEGYLVALDSQTGEEKWRTPRNPGDNWASPIIARTSGKDQLIIAGQLKIHSYDPSNGKLLWEAPHISQATCGTAVWTDDAVFASGGFPKNETKGVKSDGSGQKLWSNNERAYEQSMLAHGGYIYSVTDQGFAHCWRASDGEEMWKERLGRGGVMASPAFANGHIYAPIKNGTTTVFKATHEGFQKVAVNKLGDDTYASPVLVDKELFLRVGFSGEDGRREVLYSLGK
ncbi:MAG: PQQ-binding-like beta-propeller repeat protein [Verrucomicrobiaceae bacterium]